jgi:hypothetical protein
VPTHWGVIVESNLPNALCRRISGIVWLLSVVALLAACGGGGGGGGEEPERVVTTVTVTSPTQSLLEGESVQLTAVTRDQFGDAMSGVSVAWSSSEPTVATIASSGLLQARAPGAMVATAAVGEVVGSLPLTVASRSAASVTLISPTTNPKEGDKLQLSAVVRDQAGNTIPGAEVTWSSSDTEIAVISAAGVVSAYSTGEVVVTAKANGTSGRLTLTITPILVSASVGAKESAFVYATDRCLDTDIPDQAPRIVRAEDGTLVLFAGNAPRYFISRGASFASFKRDCTQPALTSADSQTPESYENWEWIWTVYRQNDRWHALISNEFHDAVAETCSPGDPSPGNPCWYNSVTYAVSTDSARSFAKPSPPAHVVAPAPHKWIPPAPGVPPSTGFPGGYMEGYVVGASIVGGADGFFYAFVWATPDKFLPPLSGPCPIRTKDLNDPASWRAWDGSGFNLRLLSPYVTGTAAPLCVPVRPGVGLGNLTYNSYLQRYMVISPGGEGRPDTAPCGMYISLSADLLHWSDPQLLVEAKTPWCTPASEVPGALEPVGIGYPAIIDHADGTINFERPGRSAYLYYVRFNRSIDDPLYWQDRDVIRVPLTLTRVD